LPFRPHTLEYKLRALFDANVLSPQDLARSIGVPVAAVDRYMRGARPDAVTRLQIDKVLSYYSRLRERHLKLEPGALDAEVATTGRPGLMEELDAAAGMIELKARDTAGGRMALFQLRADCVDDELLSDLERWYERKNPTHLKLADVSEQKS
jgi:hypothetical protein